MTEVEATRWNLSFGDAEADAEFGWMLEMWGYSIAAAKVNLRHKLDPLLQIEPSQQFGVRITPEAAGPRWYEAGGEPLGVAGVRIRNGVTIMQTQRMQHV